MRLLKVALLVELMLGVIWTILVGTLPSGNEAFHAVYLFPFFALPSVICMVSGVMRFWKRPETRPLASAVIAAPIILLFMPAALRSFAGGPLAVNPEAWFIVIALPLGACVFLPHHVATFLPSWALRSRVLNVGAVIVLSLLAVPWLFAVLVIVAGAITQRLDVPAPFESMDAPGVPILVGLLTFAILTAVVAATISLTSYVGLFQRIDRSQQRLRVGQLVLSLALLVPSVPVIAFGSLLAAAVLVNPG